MSYLSLTTVKLTVVFKELILLLNDWGISVFLLRGVLEMMGDGGSRQPVPELLGG